jgi:hypothetical protein
MCTSAGATIREGLLAAVVDHLLELDVEIRWQDISERPGAGHTVPILVLHQTLALGQDDVHSHMRSAGRQVPCQWIARHAWMHRLTNI